MPKNYNLFLKGGVGGWNFNADMVNFVLDKHQGSEVHVLIDSLGGYTSVAVSISSLFKLHGNVHVHFVGHNASAATIAAMGAKRVTIDEDAAFLVHKCLVPVLEWDYMNADDLDAHIKELEALKKDNETIDNCVAGIYARRCKKTKDELLALMKVGGWLTPEEALEWGFVDEITRFVEDEAPVLSEQTISSLSAAGIPLPPNFAKKNNSVLERLLAFLQNSFLNPAPDGDTEGAPKNNSVMANLSSLCTLLGASLAMSDDKLFLTSEQVDKVNSALGDNKKTIETLNSTVADKDKEVESLKVSIADKDKTIAELKNAPADTTGNVVDDKKNDDPYAPVSVADALAVSKAFASL